MPLHPESALALKLPKQTFMEDINLYQLCVTGLSSHRYRLFVDDKEVGLFTAKELAEGVNLATLTSGAIYDQGQKLLQAIIEKNNLYANRWRQVQLYQPPTWLSGAETESRRTQEISRLDQEISRQEDVIEQLRQPTAHEFWLRPVRESDESDPPRKLKATR
jgi:hypothetical protein